MYRHGDFGIYVQHDYTAAGHGKGLHDSEGGHFKRACNDELRRQGGQLLKTASDVHRFASEKLKASVTWASSCTTYFAG